MKIAVIGGGASGCFLAGVLSEEGVSVTLFEKNEKLLKKLYITGKGRCNLTNDCDANEFFENVSRNPKFLFSSIYSFLPSDTMGYFEKLGLRLKVERGNRVFPLSDKSSDVMKALQKQMKFTDIKLNEGVLSVERLDKGFSITSEREKYNFDIVVIASGGITYKSTGSTGDGYKFAKEFQHTIIDPKPALIGYRTSEKLPLAGLTLKNVALTALRGNKQIFHDFGELLFTHEGVSGPIVLSASSFLARENLRELKFEIDIKPALSHEKLDDRVLRDFEKYSNKNFKYALVDLLPSSMIDVVVSYSNISPEKKVNLITKAERASLVELLKAFPIKVISTSDENTGIITAGGVKVSEIYPKTMMSKLHENLYFIGEVLDVDGMTGGFNLQIAFATAMSAAKDIIEKTIESKIS